MTVLVKRPPLLAAKYLSSYIHRMNYYLCSYPTIISFLYSRLCTLLQNTNNYVCPSHPICQQFFSAVWNKHLKQNLRKWIVPKTTKKSKIMSVQCLFPRSRSHFTTLSSFCFSLLHILIANPYNAFQWDPMIIR